MTPSSCDTCVLIAAACAASSSQLSRNTAAARSTLAHQWLAGLQESLDKEGALRKGGLVIQRR